MKGNPKQIDCALLENMKLADKMLFLSTVSWQQKRYHGRKTIQLHDSDRVGQLMDGIALLSQINQQGEIILSKFISRNHIIDYPTNQQEDRYELELLPESTVYWFQRDEFYAFARENPEFFRQIVSCETAERKFLDRYLASTSKARAIDKVYELLIWFSQIYASKTFVVPVPYTRLAPMIGLSRDRFKECLNMLVEQQRISIHDTYRFTIEDEPDTETDKE